MARGKRGRGGRGRGYGQGHNRGRAHPHPPTAAPPPSSATGSELSSNGGSYPTPDAIPITVTGSGKFLDCIADGRCPAKRTESDNNQGSDPGGVKEISLSLSSWFDLDSLLTWFRDACDIDHDAVLRFPPTLSKAKRAMVHGSAAAVGLGALATLSEGLGEERHVSVVRKGSAAEVRASKAASALADDPTVADKASLLFNWARNAGVELSRDEALEAIGLMVTGKAPLPPALGQVWASRWPTQEAVAALCAAATRKPEGLRRLAAKDPALLQNPNLHDELTGATPLCAAVAAGNTDAVEILVEAGAPIDAPDASGTTPLELSRRLELSDVEGVLLRAGANDPRASEWLEQQGARSEGGSDGLPSQHRPVPSSVVSACGTDVAANAAELGSVIAADDYVDSEYAPEGESPEKEKKEMASVLEEGPVAGEGNVPMDADGVGGNAYPAVPKVRSWKSIPDTRDKLDAWFDEWSAWAGRNSGVLLAGTVGTALAAASVIVAWRARGRH